MRDVTGIQSPNWRTNAGKPTRSIPVPAEKRTQDPERSSSGTIVPLKRPRLVLRRTWLFIGWLGIAAVNYLSLTPNTPKLDLEYGDKLQHLAAYGSLMLWFAQLRRGPPPTALGRHRPDRTWRRPRVCPACGGIPNVFLRGHGGRRSGGGRRLAPGVRAAEHAYGRRADGSEAYHPVTHLRMHLQYRCGQRADLEQFRLIVRHNENSACARLLSLERTERGGRGVSQRASAARRRMGSK